MRLCVKSAQKNTRDLKLTVKEKTEHKKTETEFQILSLSVPLFLGRTRSLLATTSMTSAHWCSVSLGFGGFAVLDSFADVFFAETLAKKWYCIALYRITVIERGFIFDSASY